MYEQCFSMELKPWRKLSAIKKAPSRERKRANIRCANYSRPQRPRITAKPKSPSPSLAGQTAIVDQAVLLASGHNPPTPSRSKFPSDIYRSARCYSGGTALALPTFLLSLPTPDPIAIKLSNHFHLTYRLIIARRKISVKRIDTKLLQFHAKFSHFLFITHGQNLLDKDTRPRAYLPPRFLPHLT